MYIHTWIYPGVSELTCKFRNQVSFGHWSLLLSILFDWLRPVSDRSDNWLVGWLVGRLVGWLIGWLVNWLVGWLVDWLVGWLVG